MPNKCAKKLDISKPKNAMGLNMNHYESRNAFLRKNKRRHSGNHLLKDLFLELFQCAQFLFAGGGLGSSVYLK